MSATFRSDMKVELVDFMGGDARVVQAARTSTQKDARDRAEEAGLIGFLLREHHEVPLEHNVFTFYLEIPVFVSRQLVKHRITSISETSGRYRELDPEFYVPDEHRPMGQVGKTGDYNMVDLSENYHTEAQETIKDASRAAWTHYTDLLSLGCAKEAARMVLPVNIYSQMFMTINARSLMNLLVLRNDHHAQYEIREVAAQMEEIFEQKMPLTYASWVKTLHR